MDAEAVLAAAYGYKTQMNEVFKDIASSKSQRIKTPLFFVIYRPYSALS
jgi:hypothetical protein